MTRRIKPRASIAALLAATVPVLAHAQGAAPLARAFGAREGISQISLSPDGSRVAMIVPAGARGAALMIADPAKGGLPVSIMQTSGNPEKLASCQWTTTERLVCRAIVMTRNSNLLEGYTRLFAINADGKDFKLITARVNERSLYFHGDGGRVLDLTGDGKGNVLVARQYVPESSIDRVVQKNDEGLGVERVDLKTLQRRPVERAKRDAVEYISNGVGTVRIMGVRPIAGTGYSVNEISYFYRKPESRTWEPLSKLELLGGRYKGFNPYAVDPKLNVAFGFDDYNGRQALWKVALDGSLKRDLVLANTQVDVDDLIQIGRHRRVVGASIATDLRRPQFFDPELAALSKALAKALPKQPLVSFVDASTDESKLLMFAGGDTHPGAFYLFEKQSRKLAEVLPVRADLADVPLATMKPITFPAADGTKIPGYLTLPVNSDGKNLPAIVMPHGGPSARDEWGFDWWAQFFAARGFAVLQPNFRGSAGYGSDWFADNGFKSWKTAIGDVNDAGRWLLSSGIARHGKLGIVGWSYGGYAALQSGVVDPDLYKAVIAVAPVTDLAAWKQEFFERANYPQVLKMVGEGPHVREGSPAQNAAAIRAPVLMFHGDLDMNVEIEEARLMERALRGAGKSVELVEYKGMAHSLDDSTVRADMLEKSDVFLRKSLGL